jgi:hypothetical protein
MERDQISCLPNQAEYAGSVSGLGAFQEEVAVHAARPYMKVRSVCGSNKSRLVADNTTAPDKVETHSSDLKRKV